jgi:benzoyl-CoA reductase/2-hydroxyglutaryl-CoA dehydratase subunit BcrC/BadD/HgdB
LPLVETAKLVERSGVIPLKVMFCSPFQSKGYKSDKAIRQFMQLPVVILKVKGTLHVLEYSFNAEYERLQERIEKLISEQKLSLGLNREALKALCDLASTASI